MTNAYDVIILAAGSATRFNHQSDMNKVLMPLGPRPVFDYSLSQFLTDSDCRNILLVVRKDEHTLFEDKIRDLHQNVSTKIIWVNGGKERQDSVSRALKQLPQKRSGNILVHDAARPFISKELIHRLLSELVEYKAVIPGLKVKDSMKLVEDSLVYQSLVRSSVRHIQTPQAFRTEDLIQAVKEAEKDGFYGNEEGELVERLGNQIKVVEGLEENFKITTAMDYTFAQFLVNHDQNVQSD